MSILIVEDNPVNAKLLTLMLQAGGYQTVVTGNGKEALARMSEMETPAIQLIITDYMMPDIDGLELIVKVRASAAWSHIPILVASAHANLETVKRMQGVKCDGFLVKPIDKHQLLTRVEQLVRFQPQGLLGKNTAMDRLGLGLAEYNDLVSAFADQLAAILPIVVLEKGESDEPISENLGRSLKELAKSTSMLGAEKFALLYSKGRGRGLPTRSACAALQEALQELEIALQDYLQSHQNPTSRS